MPLRRPKPRPTRRGANANHLIPTAALQQEPPYETSPVELKGHRLWISLLSVHSSPSPVHRPTTFAPVRLLLPEAVDDVDPVALHTSVAREAHAERPYLLVNMIESLDGATVIDGVSGGLGGEGDHLVFRAVRAVPDVILVAARTANAEGYRSPQIAEEIREQRRERGQATIPRLAVVTGQLSVDLSLPMFTEPSEARPLVITSEAAPENRRDEVEAVAEVVVAGETSVDLTEAMAMLHRRGADVVLCEGGPSMNGGLVAEDLVDEWNVSLSPTLAGGDSRRIVNTAPPALRPLELQHILEHQGTLFLRYTRA